MIRSAVLCSELTRAGALVYPPRVSPEEHALDSVERGQPEDHARFDPSEMVILFVLARRTTSKSRKYHYFTAIISLLRDEEARAMIEAVAPPEDCLQDRLQLRVAEQRAEGEAVRPRPAQEAADPAARRAERHRPRPLTPCPHSKHQTSFSSSRCSRSSF